MASPKVRTCLTFAGEAEDAARLYVSLVSDSAIDAVFRPDGTVVVVEFTLAGTPYMALNAPFDADFTPKSSIIVLCEDQAEVDRLWSGLGEGGETGQCGWLRDRFGVSWQIVPRALPELMTSPDKAAVGRVHAAMLTMHKIDIAALQRAAN